jgi:hypothetical protein
LGGAIDEIIRPDWSEKPRDEQGRFLTKSDAELRQQWENEGGYEFNMQRVRDAEAVMLAYHQRSQPTLSSFRLIFSARQWTTCGSPPVMGLTAARLSLKRS